ncbi:hypothetical protein WJX84_000338 [Apatococcus fuscideae]|uniref:Cytochrome b561 domain-containing protein n=1 Tax=Apatococcus fuscideae TaxID=2026836 RepID=A0AAW1T8Q7_9CHLO
MSVGFLGLVGQGILTAHSARGLQGAERSRLLTQHALWQVAGLALVAIAIWAVYQSKEIRGTPHFTNLHSWTGLATLALATLTPIGGALAFGKTGLLQLFPKGLQPVVKTAHRNAGVVTILVATAAMELGLAMPTAYQGALSRWMQVIIGIVAALIAYRAWCSDPEAQRSKAQ